MNTQPRFEPTHVTLRIIAHDKLPSLRTGTGSEVNHNDALCTTQQENVEYHSFTHPRSHPMEGERASVAMTLGERPITREND